MAMNFDVNKIRYIAQGEVNGSVRFLALVLCAAGMWIGSSWLSGMARSASSSLALSQARYVELNQLASDYKLLVPTSAPKGEVDVTMVFTQVSAMIELRSRVNSISPLPDGKRCFVEITRMYAEELTSMVHELSVRGVKVLTAEISTIPAGDERLFNLKVTIGTEA